jgi:PAT family acetyl-CoA transporter-like MFS transporter 1
MRNHTIRVVAICMLTNAVLLFVTHTSVTYRLPVALSDNVKFLKAVEYGLSKSTTALLSPTLILPLGILVPIAAHKIWHMAPLQQFATAYRFRVTLIPLLDLLMLYLLKSGFPHSSIWFWLAIIASTAGQAIVNSLQFNAQMIFFASRVDPAIGGSYMTLLNTAANLGGTWPASFVMWLIGILTPTLSTASAGASGGGTDPYTMLQLVFSAMGVGWIIYFGPKLRQLAALPGDAWRTHLLLDDGEEDDTLESGEASVSAWFEQQQQQQPSDNTEKNK